MVLVHKIKEGIVHRVAKPASAKDQLNIIYIVRALAILGVIFVHVTSIPVGEIVDKSSSMFFYFNFLNVFNKFGTPTFIFLSALVLFYSYFDRPLNGKLIARFYQRRFLYILTPYLIFSAFYYVIQIYYSFGETWGQFAQHASFADFFTMVLYGKTFYHLYFVFISAQLYVLFPLLLWFLQRYPRVTKHLIWIGLALQWAFVLYNHFSLHYADKGQLAISYISYYLMGAFCGIYYPAVKDWMIVTWSKLFSAKALLWIPLWALWIFSSFGDVNLWYQTRVNDFSASALLYECYWFFHTFTSPLILLQISYLLYRNLNAKVVNTIIHLGVASFGVYIIHAAVLFYYFRLPVSYTPATYYLYIASGYAVTLLISWTIVGLAQKYVKSSWMLFGSKPKVLPYVQSRPVAARHTTA
ncbi:Acyltransferase family protein [Paenibacillus konkukensis]|uniref:Acyltransferase family protein n=1 Tax=Paenibacillus konkukensis TaxID=2020716 RepID=A0ABY4RR17_9BACL|nr:acyltransferase [Paenibacillus konkukensis]UQZ84139.1 Acyltransferase family protein [Paenibacillus konkukensis]